MQNVIALRKENIDLTEKRSPLSPIQVKKIADSGIKVVIEPWQQRHFPDSLYEQNRAQLSENLNEANIIFGVKEIPLDDLYPGKAHCFFSILLKDSPIICRCCKKFSILRQRFWIMKK